MSGSSREALRNVWSGRETLPSVGDGWEVLSDVREWSIGPPGCPGLLGGPFGCPGLVGMPSRMSRSGRKALVDVWE